MSNRSTDLRDNLHNVRDGPRVLDSFPPKNTTTTTKGFLHNKHCWKTNYVRGAMAKKRARTFYFAGPMFQKKFSHEL